MATAPTSGKHRPRFAFSLCSSTLAIVAVAMSLAFVNQWGKAAIPIIEWICGVTVVLWVISMIVDWRRH